MTKYTSELSALTGHTAYTSFGAGADTLGITAFDLEYATVAEYNKALGIMLLYKTCQALGFTGPAYTVTISAMTAADVHAFITTLKSA
jgi:hypothetical protein